MWETIGWFALAMVALFYVLAPLLMRATLALPRTVIEASGGVPADAVQYVRSTALNLRDEGFVASPIYAFPGPTRSVMSFCSLLTSQPMQLAALASVTYANGLATVKYVECLSLLPDGRCVLTNNSPQMSAFADQPDRDVLQLPGVVSPSNLVRLHRERARRTLGARADFVLPRPGEEAAFILRAIEHSLSYQAQRGLLRDAGETYRLTLWGAYRMTWAELPPFKQVRRMRMKAKARRAMLALGEDPRSAL